MERPAGSPTIVDVLINGQSALENEIRAAVGEEVDVEVIIRDESGSAEEFVTNWVIARGETVPTGDPEDFGFEFHGWLLFNCTAMAPGSEARIEDSGPEVINSKPVVDGSFSMPEQPEDLSVSVGGLPEGDRCRKARFRGATDSFQTTVRLPDVGGTGVVADSCQAPRTVQIGETPSLQATITNDTVFNQNVDVRFLASGTTIHTVPNLTIDAGETVDLGRTWDSTGDGGANRTIVPGNYTLEVEVIAPETGTRTLDCGPLRVVAGEAIPEITVEDCIATPSRTNEFGQVPADADFQLQADITNEENVPIEVRMDWRTDPPGMVAADGPRTLQPGETETFNDDVTGTLATGNYEWQAVPAPRFP